MDTSRAPPAAVTVGNVTYDTAGVNPQHSGGRQQAQREARRAELIDAAIAAIRRNGPDVAMEDIAAEAGVTKPILYRHFQNKAGLYMAVSERTTQLMRSALLPGLSGQVGPKELLRTAIDTYLTFIEAEPELYRFVVRRCFADRPVPQDPVTTNNQLIANALTGIFGDRLRSLGMDPGGAGTWAHAGVGMVQAAGDWWLERRTLEREALRDYLLMLAWGAAESILAADGSPERMLTAAASLGSRP
ncbi:MAG: TetR family transcriptional regulator [Pseudonocardiaceae bacterium]|nr:TetR family transcriptional regulator [Pseudonocardiaceae bacterium]